MTPRLASIAVLTLLPAAVRAADAGGSYVRPTFSLQGVSERASGASFAGASDLERDLALCVGAGLDGRGQWNGGGVDWSALAFANNPTPDGHDGFLAAARARGFDDLGEAWRLRFDASLRLQRRETATLSDYGRSDLSLGVDRKGAVTLGLRVGDRRRSVRDGTLAFDRQSLLASATWGTSGGHRFRVEAGPQVAHAPTARGWRAAGTLEWAARLGGWTTAVRGTWLEPFDARRRGASSGSFDVLAPPAFPAPLPMPAPIPGPSPSPTGLTPPDPAATQPPVRVTPPADGLLGPSLIVDPQEDDENDWDIGLRKQQLVAVASRGFSRTVVSAELRAELERGPDLLSPLAPHMERERLAARLGVRRAVGTRWALLAQAGWQRLEDDRPGRGYSHGLLSLGVELRP
jgi:hypothetical protein